MLTGSIVTNNIFGVLTKSCSIFQLKPVLGVQKIDILIPTTCSTCGLLDVLLLTPSYISDYFQQKADLRVLSDNIGCLGQVTF